MGGGRRECHDGKVQRYSRSPAAMGMLVSQWRKVQWKKPGCGMWRQQQQAGKPDAATRARVRGDHNSGGEMEAVAVNATGG
eukprot:7619481-Prorocentrum_lima.AAC.1